MCARGWCVYIYDFTLVVAVKPHTLFLSQTISMQQQQQYHTVVQVYVSAHHTLSRARKCIRFGCALLRSTHMYAESAHAMTTDCMRSRERLRISEMFGALADLNAMSWQFCVQICVENARGCNKLCACPSPKNAVETR